MSMAGEFYSLEPRKSIPKCKRQDCEDYNWWQDSWGSGCTGCRQLLCNYKKISYEKILKIQKEITYDFKRDMRTGDLCVKDIKIQRGLIKDIEYIIQNKFDKEIEEKKIKEINRMNEEIKILENKIEEVKNE